jgi:uncharacterized protein (DUF1697 family)
MKSVERYVALLRGVNVGGKNKIAMKSLAVLFSDASCHNVETYIQSGNVVFSADAKTAARVGAAICGQIQSQFGFQTHIILRSHQQLARIEASNPYSDLEKCYVAFLAETPAAERIALLDPNRSSPDQFTVSGSEIYLYFPKGVADSKLTNAYFDSKLKTVSTMRNWNTLRKLLAMMAA